MTLPAEKARNFRGSLGRLMAGSTGTVVIGSSCSSLFASVFFAVLRTRLLGSATNIVFAGVVGAQLPPGSRRTGDEGLRVSGQNLRRTCSPA